MKYKEINEGFIIKMCVFIDTWMKGDREQEGGVTDNYAGVPVIVHLQLHLLHFCNKNNKVLLFSCEDGSSDIDREMVKEVE